MKRVPLPASSADLEFAEPTRLEQALALGQRVDGQAYTAFAPLHYEPNYAYPLLIWLFGPTDDSRHIVRIMPQISMRNYVGLGLQLAAAAGRPDAGVDASNDRVEATEASVFRGFELMQRKYNIACHRVFLAGHSANGTLAMRIGLRNPRCFAGICSVGGPFPIQDAPLARLEQLRDLPLLIAAGRQSNSYPEHRLCDELRLFHAGGMHVTVRQYPGKNDLTPQILGDLNAWMMEQITGEDNSNTHDLSPLDRNDCSL